MSEAPPPIKKVPGRPFLKGQSGNPSGRPKLPEELRKHKGITSEEVRLRFAAFADKSIDELRALSTDGSLSGLEYNIVMSLLNPDKFPFYLDRMAGKVAEKLEQITLNLDPGEYEEIPKEALIRLVGETKE